MTSHAVVVNTIGATTTRTGIRVHAELDPGSYPTGFTVPDEVMDALPLTGHDWHGAWNYTLRPQELAPTPVPRQEDRTQPEDWAPAWLHHVMLTGLKAHEFAALLADAERYILDHPPISLHHKRVRHRALRRGPLSLSDRLQVTFIHFRWRTRKGELTRLLSAPAAAVGDAVLEIVPVLDGLRHTVAAAPITALTARALEALVGRSHDQDCALFSGNPLENYAHRLSPTDIDFHFSDLGRSRPTFLRDPLNNPRRTAPKKKRLLRGDFAATMPACVLLEPSAARIEDFTGRGAHACKPGCDGGAWGWAVRSRLLTGQNLGRSWRESHAMWSLPAISSPATLSGPSRYGAHT
ncbi:hypothetical protein GCM10027590_36820 [Nocardiopsis nanhaiensis]